MEVAERAGWRADDLTRAFVDAGAMFLQLRAKRLSSGALLNLATSLAEIVHAQHGILIVNDRADIAKLSGADGVHLGQDDLDPRAARRILGASAIVGRSTHTPAQLDASRAEPIDYVAIGPVFGTATKATGYEAVGLAMVARAAETGHPVVAIGGITLDRAASVIAAGAASVAVISDLIETGDPAARVRAYLERLRV